MRFGGNREQRKLLLFILYFALCLFLVRFAFSLLHFSEIHAIGILQACDRAGAVLDFEISLHDLNVHVLAFLRVAAVGANVAERDITIVGEDEVLDSRVHDCSIVAPSHVRGIELRP